MTRWTPLLAGCVAMSAWGGPIYLQMDGIRGEAGADHHAEWIEVAGFTSSIVAGSEGSSGGQPGKRIALSAGITFLKSTDKSSPKLAAALCRSTVLPTARFEFLANDARGVRFYVVELEEVSVTTWEMAGEPADRPSELVGLDFARATWTYTELSPSGEALADHQAQDS